MESVDLNIDNEGDLIIKNGDFDLHLSDQVHIEHILKSNKGYWFEHPLLGVGIIDEQNGSKTKQEIKQNIRRQLVFDDYSVKKIEIKDNYNIIINAVKKK